MIKRLLGAMPQQVLKVLEAFFPWYWRLSLVPMLVVTALIGVGAIVALSLGVVPGSVKAEGRHVIGSVLLLWLLLVLLLGVIRPKAR